jgi:hypothetical protein
MKEPPGIDQAPDNNSNLDGLIQQISLNRCCAFVGAGLSCDAGYPLWHEIIKSLKSKAQEIIGHEIELNDSNWEQVEILRNSMGEVHYKAELINIFCPDGKRWYLPTHLEISRIPFVAHITTNYDYCLENAAMVLGMQKTVQYYPELDITRLREGDIFHIHGVIPPENPEQFVGSVILSDRDYKTAYQPNTGLPRFLGTLSEFYNLVFIGYSLGDTDLTKVIRTTQLELEQRGQTEIQVGLGKRIPLNHYIIMHKDAQVNSEAFRELGLLPIFYSGDQVYHSDLQKLLSYIRMRTTGINYPEPIVNREMFEDGYHG